MALRAGRAASWLGRNAKRAGSSVRHGDLAMPAAVAGIGVAGVMGAGSAIMDSEGPWGDVQEFAMGDRDAIRASLKAGISDFTTRNDPGQYGRNDEYYGRPVSTSSARTNPVSGEMVFGMYNLRR